MLDTYFGQLDSPVGLIAVTGTTDAVTSVVFVEERRATVGGSAAVNAAVEQLGQYLAGTRREFDLPLDLRGTDFQRQVWSS